ncbi:MAG: hypothetical protein ACRCZ5_05425, partial [Burkholderiales bacterium]
MSNLQLATPLRGSPMGARAEARFPLWTPILLAIGYFAAGLLSYWFSSASGAFAESVFIHEGFGLGGGFYPNEKTTVVYSDTKPLTFWRALFPLSGRDTIS